MGRERTRQGGFTLPELLTVVALVILIGTFALPTVYQTFGAGAEAQAFNIVYAQMNAARTLALRTGKYTCVHFQCVTEKQALQGVCYSGIFTYDSVAGVFAPATGYDLQRLPGGIALGRVTQNTIRGTDYVDNTGVFTSNLSLADGTIDPCFLEGTVVFAPNGTVTPKVNGADVAFDLSRPTWTNFWNSGYVSTTGISALTMFNYFTLTSADDSQRSRYMTKNGEIISVNVYTGQLISRR